MKTTTERVMGHYTIPEYSDSVSVIPKDKLLPGYVGVRKVLSVTTRGLTRKEKERLKVSS